MVANEKLRIYAKEKGVKMWQIADALHIADSTLCRRLRRELSEAEMTQCIAVIDQLAQAMNDAPEKF